MEVHLHAFLTSALSGDERPASRTFHFIPGYEIDKGEAGLKGVLDAVKNKIFLSLLQIQPLLLVLPADSF